MWRSRIKTDGEHFVFTDLALNYAEKIDLRTGLPLNNQMNWNCVISKLFTVHGGIMNVETAKVQADSSIVLKIQHLLDCQVKYSVNAKLDVESGVITFLIPIEIEECSMQCSLQR